MTKLSIEDLDLNGRRVLIRVDFNVPIREGQVDNDKRGIKLRMEWAASPNGARPGAPPGPDYAHSLIDLAVPVTASLWVQGMGAPVRPGGRLLLTHSVLEAHQQIRLAGWRE